MERGVEGGERRDRGWRGGIAGGGIEVGEEVEGGERRDRG